MQRPHTPSHPGHGRSSSATALQLAGWTLLAFIASTTTAVCQEPADRPPEDRPPEDRPPEDRPPAERPSVDRITDVAKPPGLDLEDVKGAVRTAGLDYDQAELKGALRAAQDSLRAFAQLRSVELTNAVPPAFGFRPIGSPPPIRAGVEPEFVHRDLDRPEDLDDLAFVDIRTLASLIHSKKISCRELTTSCLRRLREADRDLYCVIEFLDERALRRADELDTLLEDGTWLGPLHGIPYGAKDLLAARGGKTTWGAQPYRDQILDQDAAVIEQLEAAGAVLCAKLSLGALAMGDVWFGGQTRSPWNPEVGSSGSSAGSAAATAAGALPFAIGSETLGSIVSPSTRCGCSSLRPTFGLIDTRGAMALSWTMDKLGPICRSADDAAIVFEGMLPTKHPTGFVFRAADTEPAVPDGPAPRNLDTIRIGFDARAFGPDTIRGSVLEDLRRLGVELLEVELPEYPVDAMMLILTCEAACAFDAFTRDGLDDQLTRQTRDAWPALFRAARLVPAVEYIRAQRLRTLLMRDVEAALSHVDVYVHPSFSASLSITNLTGHPSFVAPLGTKSPRGTPHSITFTGRPYHEAQLLTVVRRWQEATGHHDLHPQRK